MTSETTRTFICFEIDPEVRTVLGQIIADCKKFGEQIRWPKPENIHLTLKFLGDASSEQIEEIARILEDISAGIPSLQITLDLLGIFPNIRTPRILWAGSSKIPEALVRLVASLEERLAPLGFEKQKRAYRPHLTLGRVRGRESKRTVEFFKKLNFEPRTFICDEIVMMKSDLQLTGAIYTVLNKFKLQMNREA